MIESLLMGIGIFYIVVIFIICIIPMLGSLIVITKLWILEGAKDEGWVIGLLYLLSFVPIINIFIFFLIWEELS